MTQAARPVAEILQSVPRPANVVLSSFSPTALACGRDRAPDVPRALIIGEMVHLHLLIRRHLFPTDVLEKLACEAVHFEASLVTPWLVEYMHRLDYRVRVWTVDKPTAMRRYARMGVDGIFSNRPGLLVETMRATGQRSSGRP